MVAGVRSRSTSRLWMVLLTDRSRKVTGVEMAPHHPRRGRGQAAAAAAAAAAVLQRYSAAELLLEATLVGEQLSVLVGGTLRKDRDALESGSLLCGPMMKTRPTSSTSPTRTTSRVPPPPP